MSIYERYNKSYINGEWVEGQSGRKADVLNPFDESVLFSISLASSEQVADAFAIANEAQKQWANSPAEVRAEVMKKAAEFLRNNRDEIVPAMSRETGSSLLKSNIEFDLTLEILDAAPNFVHQVHTVKEFPAAIPGKINRVYRLPLGVISSISPFNFPMNLSMRTIAPAIALGNTVVHKPGNQVIFTGGGIIAAAFEYAGLPKGVFNLVVTDSREIGDEMLTNPIPKLISFTGSTEVGRHIGKIAGENLKRVALELGGNNPFIVLADADLERAVDAAIFGKYIHQGQICMSINRIIVHKDLYEPFIENLSIVQNKSLMEIH